MTVVKARTTNSPFPLRSPLRTLSRESSFLPFPNVAPWMSVAKKHTEAKTRESNAALRRILTNNHWLGISCAPGKPEGFHYSRLVKRRNDRTYEMTAQTHPRCFTVDLNARSISSGKKKHTTNSAVAIRQRCKKVNGESRVLKMDLFVKLLNLATRLDLAPTSS
jgi:hypothetical protein